MLVGSSNYYVANNRLIKTQGSSDERPCVCFKLPLGSSLILPTDSTIPVVNSTGLVVKSVTDVSIQDHLLFNYAPSLDVHNLHQIDKYYLLGLWYGDGVRVKDPDGNYYCRILTNPDETDLQDALIHAGFVKKFSYNKGCNYANLNRNLSKFIFSSFPNDTYKENFDVLLSLTLPELLQFVRGYFDADGGTTKTNMTLSSKASRVSMLELCAHVLLSFGIPCHVSNSYYSRKTQGVIDCKANYLRILSYGMREFTLHVNPLLTKKHKVNSTRNSVVYITKDLGLYYRNLGLSHGIDKRFLLGERNVSALTLSSLVQGYSDSLSFYIKQFYSTIRILDKFPCVSSCTDIQSFDCSRVRIAL